MSRQGERRPPCGLAVIALGILLALVGQSTADASSPLPCPAEPADAEPNQPTTREERSPLNGKSQLLIGISAGLALGAAWSDGTDRADGLFLRPPFRRAVNIPIVGGAAVLTAAQALLHKDAHPGARVECESARRERVFPLDAKARALIQGDQGAGMRGSRISRKDRNLMNSLSNITLLTLAVQPLGHASTSGHRGQINDALVPYEAAALSLALVNVVKHVVHRPRPYAQYCDPPEANGLCSSGARESFYSGHTSTAFALAVSSARVASFLEYKHAGAIKAVGLSLAAATGALRVTSDRHYLTDVLVGAGVGWGLGWAVSELHKPKRSLESGDRLSGEERSAGAGGVGVSIPVGSGARTWLHARVGKGFELRLSGTW